MSSIDGSHPAPKSGILKACLETSTVDNREAGQSTILFKVCRKIFAVPTTSPQQILENENRVDSPSPLGL